MQTPICLKNLPALNVTPHSPRNDTTVNSVLRAADGTTGIYATHESNAAHPQNNPTKYMELANHQNVALEQAYALLGEHFDSCVIVVHTELSDQVTGTKLFFKGGYMVALGLINWALGNLMAGNKGQSV